MRPSPVHRRSAAELLLTVILTGVLAGLAGCSSGGGDRPAAGGSRPAAAESAERATPTRTATSRPETTSSGRRTTAEATSTPSRSPADTTKPPATTPRTSRPAEATTAATTTAAAGIDRTPTTPATTRATTSATTPATAEATTPAGTPTASIAAEPAAAESGGLGPLGWFLLILIVAALIGGLLIWRSQRRSGWDGEATALESATRTMAEVRLPPVLTTDKASSRSLSWQPVRAELVDLRTRWGLLAQNAAGEERMNRALRLQGLLTDLLNAVDAENEALATGREWRMLRPRVNAAGQALIDELAARSQPDTALD